MSKELYEDIITLIDILKTQSGIKDDKGEKIFGIARWGKMRKWINHNHGAAIVCYSDSIQVRQIQRLEAMRSDCKNVLNQMYQEEEDRELNNTYLKVQIAYARKAFIVSIIALILSLGSIVVSILDAVVWK